MKKLEEALGETEERAATLAAEKDHALKQLRAYKEVSHFYSLSVNIKYNQTDSWFFPCLWVAF